MKKRFELKLIDGQFSLLETNSIINNVTQKKIQFHQQKNFSSEIRFGKKDLVAVKRIPELQKGLADFKAFLQEQKKSDAKFMIKSFVEIELLD